MTGRVALTLLLLFLLYGPRPVAAHAELVAANPVPGAQLDEPPAEVRLTFSEPLGGDSTFTLFGRGFREVRGLTPALDPQALEQLFASIPSLEPDTYTVQWTVLSADGHPASGSYAFSVVGRPAGILDDGIEWIVAAVILFLLVASLPLVKRSTFLNSLLKSSKYL